jgi:hypothetical protein
LMTVPPVCDSLSSLWRSFTVPPVCDVSIVTSVMGWRG